ncbi:cupredoxin domain-containing protein [Ramlibacter humi]|uniref:Blue (type 1) copper domain-containing protein n=1 Tax=Ramlibacter humi TaxID=2530451 RepID=A0A4Z0CBT4_9BURK|nr:cupredoxin family copper-binding protein [Ramlibacter humi]TFZ07605.1 hypothetical protein EZ216_00095 [Ramlibacter humi]
MSPLRAAAAVAAALPLLAAAATHTVTIENMKFQPEALQVKKGDQVIWLNKDLVPHTATAAGKFDSGAIASGKSWRWTAKSAGTVAYVCTYHPGMKGSVTVK